MNVHSHEPEINHSVNPTAVSLYGQDDAMDDFPVLKAFQQYIDSEQAKARKRLISLGIFFGILMGAVIAVFLVMLVNITERNQSLNDRLIEFAMKERNRSDGPVVVQPPVQQDNSAILQLTSKIEAMQNKLVESQKRAEEAERAQQAANEAAAAARAPKTPSPQELEIERLKALLKAEKEKAAADKAKLREAELEAWRRKQYPECYATETAVQPAVRMVTPRRQERAADPSPTSRRVRPASPKAKTKAMSEDPKSILNGKAIRYFDEDDDDEDDDGAVKDVKADDQVKTIEPIKKEQKEVKTPTPASPAPATQTPAPEASYTIPVEVRGKKSSWRLPD